MSRSLLISTCLAIATAAADEVVLADGSRLTGTMTAMNGDGQVALTSELAFEPFQLRAERIQRVQMTPAKTALPDDYDAMMILASGDHFACDLQGIDGDSVSVRTGFAGDLDIPRKLIGTVQLGVRPRKTIYRGPHNGEGWNIRNGWRYDGNVFVTDGNGSLSRRFDTPGSFAVSFRLAWRNNPNIQIFFADDLLENTGRADRYHLSFDGSGFQLKRQISGENYPNKDMHSIRRDVSDFPDSQVDIELRVDRKLAQVHLYVNGIPEGKYADPMDKTPVGQGIMFLSKVAGDEVMTLQDIKIREWDPAEDRHRTEERGNLSKDVLITRSSDRGSVEIINLKEGKDGPVIVYKHPHFPDPVELPTTEVSTLFFARPEEMEVAPATSLRMGLRTRGSLSVTACAFGDGHFSVEHPLLGPLEIRREAVERLERQAAKRDDLEEAGDDDKEEEEE